jgi:hypothetical protein
LTHHFNAFPDLFKNAGDKRLNIDYPQSTAVIAKTSCKAQRRCDTSNVILGISLNKWKVIMSYF